MMAFWPPGAHLKDTAQNGLPELPREPPGSCRGPFREAQEAPRAPQDGPKSRQERPKSRPEAVSERPWRAPGADLAPKSPQEGSRRRFLPPSGIDCWLLRGSILVAPGAFWGSLSTATKDRAKSQEEKAMKPAPRI